MTVDADLLVVGGGPVGLAAAIAGRDAGMSVIVLEPRSGAIDKACGEGLMPSARRELAALGVDPPGRDFLGIRYVGAGRAVTADFRAGPGRGVRRTCLHDALAARARATGVQEQRELVRSIAQDGRGVVANGLRGHWLVAADGLHSPVRRLAGLEVPDRRPAANGRPKRYGLRRHFAVPPWTEHVEVHWGPQSEAYVTPVGPDLVGVAVLGPPGAGFDDVVSGLPELHRRLRGAQPATAVLGAGPLRQRAGRVRHGRLLLVGDAAGYVDALTGEGIAVGVAGARAAVAALAAGRPQDYPGQWAAVTRRHRTLTTLLLAVSQRPGPRQALVPAAARWPGLFARAVDLIA